MTTKTKRTGRALSIPAGLALGWAVAAGIMVGMAALLALMIHTEKLPMEKLGYGMTAMYLLSSFLGALTASRRIKHQQVLICLMAGLLQLGFLLLTTALFLGGQYDAVGVSGGLILAGSAAAGALGIRQERGGKRPGRKKHGRKVVQKFV